MPLEGRFRHLLVNMLANHEIDQLEIDCELTYWENKQNIEKRFHIDLTPKDRYKENEKYYVEVPQNVLDEIPRVEAEIIPEFEVLSDEPKALRPKRIRLKPANPGLPCWLPTTRQGFARMQEGLMRLPKMR